METVPCSGEFPVDPLLVPVVPPELELEAEPVPDPEVDPGPMAPEVEPVEVPLIEPEELDAAEDAELAPAVVFETPPEAPRQARSDRLIRVLARTALGLTRDPRAGAHAGSVLACQENCDDMRRSIWLVTLTLLLSSCFSRGASP